MGSLDIGGLWCPECGEEYRSNFVECADCKVPLSTEEPPPKPRQPRDDVDHEQVAYDLAEWSDDQRGALELMLIGAQVPHGWEGSRVLVPHQREQDTDDLIDSLEEGTVVEEAHEFDGEAGELEYPERPDLASAGRRVLGYVIDGVVLIAFSAAIGQGLLHLDSSSPLGERLVLPALIAAYEIVGVAIWGRTIGKLIAGTRVVALANDAVPGWRRATIRWAVQIGPTFLSFWIRDGAAVTIILGLLSNVWLIAVYVRVLWDPLRQGLHDKAAGTVVIG